MATNVDTRTVLGQEVSLELSGTWAGYWVAMLRLLTGWWFFHAGVTKYANLWTSAEPFAATGWLTGATQGTVVAPVTVWFGNNAAWFVNFMIPLGETLIGLALLLGVLVRFAAFWGAFLMGFFYLGNADFAHGFVNGDLMGLLLFATLIVLGAGRIMGLDRYIENSDLVQNHPRLKYLLG